MKVIIPMAGFGTRLRPLTWSKPKPLINVAGKPVLGHILDKFTGLPVEEYIFVVGYLGEQIEEYVHANYDFAARFVEQEELLGQAHALYLCREYVDGPVLIVFVDTLFEADLSLLADEPSDGVVHVREVEDPRRFGVVALDAKGHVTHFIEKPTSWDNKLVVVGLYYIKDGPKLMACCGELMERGIQTKGEYYLADALTLMVQAGARFRVREVEVWEDCGKPETVLHTNRYLLDNGHDNSAEAQREGVVLVPPVHIASSATIVHSVIGPYATIGPKCCVEYSIIRDSIIDEGAYIKDAMLDQSLVGRDAHVEGRFRVLNVGDSSGVGYT